MLICLFYRVGNQHVDVLRNYRDLSQKKETEFSSLQHDFGASDVRSF